MDALIWHVLTPEYADPWRTACGRSGLPNSLMPTLARAADDDGARICKTCGRALGFESGRS